MKAGASKVQKIAKVQKALLKQMRVQKGHGKFLLFMDTHSDYETGWVAYATRKHDGAQLVQPASEVRLMCFGPNYLNWNAEPNIRFLGDSTIHGQDAGGRSKRLQGVEGTCFDDVRLGLHQRRPL